MVEPMARPEQLALARTEIDLRLKLLDKVLASPKQVEVKAEIETNDKRSMSTPELAHRMRILLKQGEDDVETATELLEFLK